MLGMRDSILDQNLKDRNANWQIQTSRLASQKFAATIIETAATNMQSQASQKPNSYC
jgi:hypothetical protein